MRILFTILGLCINCKAPEEPWTLKDAKRAALNVCSVQRAILIEFYVDENDRLQVECGPKDSIDTYKGDV